MDKSDYLFLNYNQLVPSVSFCLRELISGGGGGKNGLSTIPQIVYDSDVWYIPESISISTEAYM